jgi:hypothetical protein
MHTLLRENIPLDQYHDAAERDEDGDKTAAVNKANNLEFGRRLIPEIAIIWAKFKVSKLDQDVMTWHMFVRETLVNMKE